MKKTVVIDLVALTPSLLGKNTPRLTEFAKSGSVATIKPIIPALTCSVQSTYLTGRMPNQHGIVGNGWYFRDESEIKFWRQSNKLVQAEKIWEKIKKIDPKFTSANLFWWYNMYSACDFTITPRPMYPADGRKIPDIYTQPANIRDSIQKDLGQFPLFNFWGPTTSIKSSQWIAKSAIWVDQKYDPGLSLIYLPHLDYNLQKYGPNSNKIKKDLSELDKICGNLIDYYQQQNTQIIFLSEYNIMPVKRAVHINRILRQNGLLKVRLELGKELLDTGVSAAFAVSDHQIAHIYINDLTKFSLIKRILQKTPGIAQILDKEGKIKNHLNHPRSGDLIILAKEDSWFTYYYWLDENFAPDFAKSVDIHRKSGYDPVELFFNPKSKFLKLKLAWTLFKKKLMFRTVMEAIPLDASLIKGSHGLLPDQFSTSPIFITHQKHLIKKKVINATEICSLIMNHLF